jgi:flagellar assembly factor FliW
MKETNIFAFEKGIFGCDKKREYRVETAHAV